MIFWQHTTHLDEIQTQNKTMFDDNGIKWMLCACLWVIYKENWRRWPARDEEKEVTSKFTSIAEPTKETKNTRSQRASATTPIIIMTKFLDSLLYDDNKITTLYMIYMEYRPVFPLHSPFSEHFTSTLLTFFHSLGVLVTIITNHKNLKSNIPMR